MKLTLFAPPRLSTELPWRTRDPPLLIEPIEPPLPREIESVPAVIVSVPPTWRFEIDTIEMFADEVSDPLTVKAVPEVIGPATVAVAPAEIVRGGGGSLGDRPAGRDRQAPAGGHREARVRLGRPLPRRWRPRSTLRR